MQMLILNAKYRSNEQEQEDMHANFHAHPATHTSTPAMILVHPISRRWFLIIKLIIAGLSRSNDLVSRPSIEERSSSRKLPTSFYMQPGIDQLEHSTGTNSVIAAISCKNAVRRTAYRTFVGDWATLSAKNTPQVQPAR